MDIREPYKGQFPPQAADELEQMERDLLHYVQFGSKEALKLGIEIQKQSEKYGEGIAIRIIRLSDMVAVFQYADNTRGERNFRFAEAKCNTVLKTGHCSLWALAQRRDRRRRRRCVCRGQRLPARRRRVPHL